MTIDGGAVRVALVALLAGVTGCATLANGTKQTIPITSSPGGVPVTIDGVPAGVTPIRARLMRSERHHVVIGADSASQVHYDMTRRLSAWLLADLIVFYPAVLFDLVIGSGLAFNTGSIHATLPANAVVASSAPGGGTAAAAAATVPLPAPPEYWGLRRGHALRLATPESRGILIDATLDSVVDERLYWRPASGVNVAREPTGVALTDASRLRVRRPWSASASAASHVNRATQLAWAVPLVLYADVGSQHRGFTTGARMAAIAIPVALVTGALSAPVRWAPFEAQRSGSPLLVNDRVRVVQHSGALVSGRLLDMTSRQLLITSGSDTARVLRTNVQSLERAEGFDWRGRAMYGAFLGAMFGFNHFATRAGPNSQADTYTVPLTGALLGLLAAPALAPRRWHTVSAW